MGVRCVCGVMVVVEGGFVWVGLGVRRVEGEGGEGRGERRRGEGMREGNRGSGRRYRGL